MPSEEELSEWSLVPRDERKVGASKSRLAVNGGLGRPRESATEKKTTTGAARRWSDTVKR